ncbi:hypothetical protein CPB86DRAFT_307100 [Serendipita vermifera]|nr:hypothetical protein CPB86DRAFT_307100 [Serendipita vermifera]
MDYATKRQQALESLQPISYWEDEAEDTEFAQYEVSDGVWAHSLDREWAGAFRKLTYQELRSPDSLLTPWEYKWESSKIDYNDLSFWASADLQMLTELRDERTCRRIHLLTISTNEPHPDYTPAYVDVFQRDCPVWQYSNSLSYEDLLALRLRGRHQSGGGIVIDCKRSKVIMEFTPLRDLAFLSREEMLLLVEEDNDISKTVALVVHSLTRGEKLYTCKLPVEIFNKTIYGAGFSTKPESQLADYRHMSPSTMFKTDPALTMICVSFRLAGNPEFVCIVLAVGPFRKICNGLLTTHPNRDQFDWEEWGPSVTSWIPCPPINVPGYRCTSGPRILMSGELSIFFKDFNDPLGLILMDFNPRPIRRCISSQQNEDSTVVEFAEGLEWKHPDSDYTIKSTLPFRAFGGKSLPVDYSNFHFEGNTIICRMRDKYGFYSFLPKEEKEMKSWFTSKSG